MTIDAASLSNAPGVRSIFKALNGEARFVGGCVRDILLGQKPGDIDITTPAGQRDETTAGCRAERSPHQD